ncbi:MAG: M1 family metallopeptidase [Bacteroidetes bacterium]|nr:M1 family metallopeptidase [Bacteroidota bacterium]
MRSLARVLVLVSLAAVLGTFISSCRSTKAAYDDKHAILLDTMQITVPRENPYRAAATKYCDLIHTRLDVRFDWAHQWLYGQEHITLSPHFYPQASVKLDAKNLDIYKVELVGANGNTSPLRYTYDTMKLDITLDREYKEGEKFTLFIDYKSKPNERRTGGSDAIQEDKGLYFINPLGTDSDKPQEIWTQGETESNSYWFPTLDKPNFKCTDDIYITVDKKYTTLSNGVLASQKDNGDGTRTDYWHMDLPHSQYLVMMAVGEFVVTKDKWRDKEVNYYIEPKYAPYTMKMFGETPAMMEFFSRRLGYDYPWQKYSQVVVRDYVSGAMENTTATLHGENLNRTPRQMLDEDYHDYISHELFHQWFGDLVTAKTWSNTTLHESFADYSEYLWNEHRYGREYADWKNYQAFAKYMADVRKGKNYDLVRFHYDDREEVFDAHTYEKGGRILHMLRYAVGDDAFFKSLQLYLQRYAYKNTEVPALRMCFEDVTGRDMNWFFDQWYYNTGLPVLDFKYSYAHDSVYVKVSQKHSTDKPLTYQLPFRIDMHYDDIVVSENVTLTKRKQTFAFKALGRKPDLIDADGERVLLCEKSENKSITEYEFQYRKGTRYMQRREALDSLKGAQKNNTGVAALYKDALRDHSESIRALAVRNILVTEADRDGILPALQAMLETDSASHVRAAVLDKLGREKARKYEAAVEKALGDSSYLVASTALITLNKLDSLKALQAIRLFAKEKVFDMKNAVYTVVALSGDSGYNGYFERKLKEDKGFSKAMLMYHYANFLCRMQPALSARGVVTIKAELLADQEKSKQLLGFGLGALERIKETYEREKAVYEQVESSGSRTKEKYKAALKAELKEIDNVIKTAKAAIEEVKAVE